MAEAGYPNGFNVDWLTPGAALLFARRAHRLAAAGDRHPRAGCRPWSAASTRSGGRAGSRNGPASTSSSPAPASARAGPIGTKRFQMRRLLPPTAFCVRRLDAKYDQYLASDNPAERKALAEEIQREILENYYFVPVFRHAFMNAIGPRIAAAKWQDVFPS